VPGQHPAGGRGALCPRCAGGPRAFAKARAFGVYDGALREHLHRVKYLGDRPAAEALGLVLARWVREGRELGPADLVVPVPLHPLRLRERGFNQADLLAAAVARALGRPVNPAALVRTRPTRAQSQLPVEAREANVRGAFAVPHPAAVRARRVLLVDDVLTTGATADAASEALYRAGASRVEVVCVAAASPRAGPTWDRGGRGGGELLE